MSVRKVIIVPGLTHGANPIPAAAMVGPLLKSGGIIGIDRANGEIPESLEDQCSNMFSNLKAIVEGAGGTTDHIVKMTVWATDKSVRDPLNEEWLQMFPDETNRPARHLLSVDSFRHPIKIQCDIEAYII